MPWAMKQWQGVGVAWAFTGTTTAWDKNHHVEATSCLGRAHS